MGSEERKKHPKKKPNPMKAKAQIQRVEEMGADYINSLRQKIRDLEDQVAEQQDLIKCLERGERRMRVWAIAIPCSECGKDHTEYVALVNRKVFQGSDYKKLVQRLRMMGYHVKENAYAEKPPVDCKPTEGEFEYLKPGVDLRDLTIPDGIPPDIMEGIED